MMCRMSSTLFAGLLGLWAGSALAEGISGEVGLGASYQAREPTGSRYHTVPVPYFDLDWGNVSLDTDDGLTWSAFNHQGFSAGPYLNYLAGRTANGPLKGLRDVSDMAEVGGFIQYAPADFWRIYAQLGRSVGALVRKAAYSASSAVSWVIHWAAGSLAVRGWWRTLPTITRPRRFSGSMSMRRKPREFARTTPAAGSRT